MEIGLLTTHSLSVILKSYYFLRLTVCHVTESSQTPTVPESDDVKKFFAKKIQKLMSKFPKRDFLLSLEQKAQSRWESEDIYRQDAPQDTSKPKYFATFPYPYMNGKLHLGHGFSLSKPEFQIRYQRMLGKSVLYPMGFHCTGMPIKAAADKIKREVELFGKNFENYVEEVDVAPPAPKEDDPKKAKHGKQVAKSVALKYQFQIMKASGVPLEEIHLFADPLHWIKYFPPLAIQVLKRFGSHTDWRRSFITTDLNGFYDSFIKWQFNVLREKTDKILFGERYTIYSPLDQQACMDHDRKSGEGVGVQEYTGIKLKALLDQNTVCERLKTDEFKKALGGRDLYLVAATLRPETMYGQTNCFVGQDLSYGVYEVSATEAWLCTERAARNMAYQNLFQEKGVVKKLFDLKGSDLVGLPLKAPFSEFDKVYTLPMEGVLATKGTGVVTSVPSDSPDDYITLLDLQKKAAYYKVDEIWVKPFLPPKPIISTPRYGNLAAVWAVENLKIQSQKDKEKLAEAKELVYKEGFYSGTILVGECKGKPVQEAKPIIRQLLIDQGLGFVYCEPEGMVVSRSGDECVVSLMSQWYLNYGEEEWKALALKCVDQMEMFTDDTKHAFLKTLDWLKQWACSRSFGLGSRLPWDPVWLIESLSDSTIYMAFYTVSHILQEGVLDGSKTDTKSGIKPEDMTDAVWSYIMLNGPRPNTNIKPEFLEKMKHEFNYFYPLDLRTSGKDLINNHLTFFIYNHVAIFPPEKWPKGIRVNGHLLLNNEKMAKSTGNFMNIEDALDKFGADATRFALADAGDSLEDANFLDKTADDAILKLFTEREWIQESLKAKLRTGEYSWHDKVFDTEMDHLVAQCQEAYEKMLYREVLKVGFYDLQNARNEYRKATTGQGISTLGEGEVFDGMHEDLVKKFARLQALVLLPIIPHWCEHIWTDLLGNETSVMHCRWPEVQKVDQGTLDAAAYIRGLGSKIRSAEDAANKKKSKKGKVATEVDGDKKLVLYVAQSFPPWQEKVLELLKPTYNSGLKTFDNSERETLKTSGLIKDKRVMPFVAMIKKLVLEQGEKAFNRTITFNELDTLKQNMDYLRRDLSNLKITQIEIQNVSDLKEESNLKNAEPGVPEYVLQPIQSE